MENVFLLNAVVSGIFITFIYDIIRIWRRVLPHGEVLVSLEDLAFWVFCAIHIFGLMHRESNGSLRWFAVMGALAGMLLYKLTISKPLVHYVSLALQWIRDLLGRVLGFIFKPVGKAGHVVGSTIKRLVKKPFVFCKNRLKNYGKLLKIRLKKQ